MINFAPKPLSWEEEGMQSDHVLLFDFLTVFKKKLEKHVKTVELVESFSSLHFPILTSSNFEPNALKFVRYELKRIVCLMRLHWSP